MSSITAPAEITDIHFSNGQMTLELSNDRVVTVPLEKFPSIQQMNKADRKDFEIIDGTYLSFLALDDVFSVEELVGIYAEQPKAH